VHVKIPFEVEAAASLPKGSNPATGIVAVMPRFAVVGHVEWVDFLTVPRVPLAGEIAHADKWWAEAAGGGAVAAVQLAKLGGTATFFTAFGNDAHARNAEAQLRAHGVEIEAAARDRPQRRGVALLDARGERTIIVQGERLAPQGEDDLPWDRLGEMDGVYFTGGDIGSLRAARAARTLVATPRAHDAFAGSDVTLDALVRSASDAGEQDGWSADVTVATRGPDGGTYTTADGRAGSFEAAPLPGPLADAYGAGDSFAAGLTFALGSGMDLAAALELAARCGAANLTGAGPYAGQLTAAAWRR
jgi:ribokinase